MLFSGTTRQTPSPQQIAVYQWVEKGEGSAFIEAVAGSGKTTTLVDACSRMRGSVALTAFNKKIASEIEGKTSHLRNVRVGTFHSFGFAAWRRHAGTVKVDATLKSRRMMDECKVERKYQSAVTRLVSIAKQSCVGILWQSSDISTWKSLISHYDVLVNIEANGLTRDQTVEVVIALASKCIEWSKEIGYQLIDFDDMIWLPLLENSPIQQYDWVLVDEAQDTNAARLLLARRMMASNARAVFCGDRYQSIYGFTGADSEAVDNIIRDFNCTLLPLTVTYRCAKEAVTIAQQWVPHITAHNANPQGSVRDAGYGVLTGDIKNSRVNPPASGDAILCRITRPLVKLAFSLLRSGIPCHVEGRDIGKSLEKLATRWRVTTTNELINRLEQYRTTETERLLSAGESYSSAIVESLNDRIDTLLVIADGCDTVDCVTRKISSLFQDTEGNARSTITLSTVHKSKGREWERVYILGFYEYMPSKWAKQEWELQQESNLQYVAVTRCKRELVLVDGEPNS